MDTSLSISYNKTFLFSSNVNCFSCFFEKISFKLCVKFALLSCFNSLLAIKLVSVKGDLATLYKIFLPLSASATSLSLIP